MTFESRYHRAKLRLLSDPTICEENRLLFEEFFEYQEYKLKRQNHLSSLDEACYKTLCAYISRFKTVNRWFGNKPWNQLTKEDIRQVYDGLEDGHITTLTGNPVKDKAGFYNKVMKSKPFRLAGKDKMVREVIEFSSVDPEKTVRYVTEQTFREITSVLSNPRYLLLFWLAWDIGENINTLLQLQKKDFIRQLNPHTQEPEYLVNLPRGKIKRSRQSRSEPTLYPETIRYLDIVLRKLIDEDYLFGFGYRQALQVLHRTARKIGATCMPNNQSVQWKDLRSGMACHLLRSGWTRDEVNARLGHTPSSKSLNAYINYLAIDRHRPKSKLHNTTVDQLKYEIEDTRRKEKLTGDRLLRQEMESRQFRDELAMTRRSIALLKVELLSALKTLQKRQIQASSRNELKSGKSI